MRVRRASVALIEMLSLALLPASVNDPAACPRLEQALEIKKKGGMSSLTIHREDAVGDIAEVAITIQFESGETDTETVTLARENGEWKIQSPK